MRCTLRRVAVANETMRYAFWVTLCAVFSHALSAKTHAAVGPAGEAGAVIYGGVVGLGIAYATRKKILRSLLFRLAVAGIWLSVMTGAYCLVFGSPGRRLTHYLITWGILFSLPAALILVFRPSTRTSNRPPAS